MGGLSLHNHLISHIKHQYYDCRNQIQTASRLLKILKFQIFKLNKSNYLKQVLLNWILLLTMLLPQYSHKATAITEFITKVICLNRIFQRHSNIKIVLDRQLQCFCPFYYSFFKQLVLCLLIGGAKPVFNAKVLKRCYITRWVKHQMSLPIINQQSEM